MTKRILKKRPPNVVPATLDVTRGSEIYAARPTEDLGEHYVRHLDHMTRESLHSKSAIAAELAWRDSLLQQMLDVADNCDETGYIDGVGFFDVDALHDQVRALLFPNVAGEPCEPLSPPVGTLPKKD